MAQFLTHKGKIVLEQIGNGDTVTVHYRGQPKPVVVTGEDWKQNKRFQRYDEKKLKRQQAYELFEAGKLK